RGGVQYPSARLPEDRGSPHEPLWVVLAKQKVLKECRTRGIGAHAGRPHQLWLFLFRCRRHPRKADTTVLDVRGERPGEDALTRMQLLELGITQHSAVLHLDQ